MSEGIKRPKSLQEAIDVIELDRGNWAVEQGSCYEQQALLVLDEMYKLEARSAKLTEMLARALEDASDPSKRAPCSACGHLDKLPESL